MQVGTHHHSWGPFLPSPNCFRPILTGTSIPAWAAPTPIGIWVQLSTLFSSRIRLHFLLTSAHLLSSSNQYDSPLLSDYAITCSRQEVFSCKSSPTPSTTEGTSDVPQPSAGLRITPIHSSPWSFHLVFHKNHPITPLMSPPSVSRLSTTPKKQGLPLVVRAPPDICALRFTTTIHCYSKVSGGHGDTQRDMGELG